MIVNQIHLLWCKWKQQQMDRWSNPQKGNRFAGSGHQTFSFLTNFTHVLLLLVRVSLPVWNDKCSPFKLHMLSVFSRLAYPYLLMQDGLLHLPAVSRVWRRHRETGHYTRRPGQGCRRSTTLQQNRFLIFCAWRNWQHPHCRHIIFTHESRFTLSTW